MSEPLIIDNDLRVNVYFGATVGLIDIGPYCLNQFELAEPYHSATYGAIKCSAKFTISDPDGTVMKYLINVPDNLLPVQVYVDDAIVFKGYVRNNFTAETSFSIKDFTIELIDRSKDLERTLTSTISWENYKICDTSNTDASIIHQLLMLGGLGSPVAFGITSYAFGITSYAYGLYTADLSSLIDVDITIDYYFKSRFDEHKIYDLIQEILLDAGYVLRVDLLGNPHIASIIPRGETPTSYTFVEGEIYNGFKNTRREIVTDTITGQYYAHELLLAQVVFNETTGGNDIYDCLIDVPTVTAYPENADDTAVVTKLNFEVKDRELIVAKYANAFLDVRPKSYFSHAKTWSSDLWYGNAVGNGAYNTNEGTKKLIRMQVVADAIVKGDMGEYTAKADGLVVENKTKVEFKYLTTYANVKTVVDGLLDNAIYGKYTHKFESELSFTLGNYYVFTDSVITSLDYNIKIIKKTPVYYWTKNAGLTIQYYKYEGISYGSVATLDVVTDTSHVPIGKSSPRIFRDAIFAEESPIVTNPEPPYALGDIWERSDGKYECTKAKGVADFYASGDWPIRETDEDHASLQVSWNGSESFQAFLNSISSNVAQEMVREPVLIGELFTQFIEILSATIRTNTLQAGSTTEEIILDTGASAVDDFYNGSILIVDGEYRVIDDYVGLTKTASVVAFSSAPGAIAYTIANIGSIRSDYYNKDGTVNTGSTMTSGFFVDAYGRLKAKDGDFSGYLDAASGKVGDMESEILLDSPTGTVAVASGGYWGSLFTYLETLTGDEDPFVFEATYNGGSYSTMVWNNKGARTIANYTISGTSGSFNVSSLSALVADFVITKVYSRTTISGILQPGFIEFDQGIEDGSSNILATSQIHGMCAGRVTSLGANSSSLIMTEPNYDSSYEWEIIASVLETGTNYRTYPKAYSSISGTTRSHYVTNTDIFALTIAWIAVKVLAG